MRFLQKITIKIQQFMTGRYGSDQFTWFLSISGIMLSFLSNILRFFRSFYIAGKIIYFIGILMILYGLIRAFSKNYEARRKELNWYLLVSAKPRAGIKLVANKMRDRKTHRYFKCKNCRTVMRVPKGRGKIEITCPKCRAKVVKKT